VISHRPDLLRGEQGLEAAELTVRDARAVRPARAGLGPEDLLCRAEPLRDVLLGGEILAAGLDVDGAGDAAGEEGDQEVRQLRERCAAGLVKNEQEGMPVAPGSTKAPTQATKRSSERAHRDCRRRSW